MMNPDWVGLSQAGCGAQIRQELDLSERKALLLPEGLWQAIEASSRLDSNRGGGSTGQLMPRAYDRSMSMAAGCGRRLARHRMRFPCAVQFPLGIGSVKPSLERLSRMYWNRSYCDRVIGPL